MPAVDGLTRAVQAFAKRHRYFALVADLDAGCVLYVGDDRKQETLDRY